MSLSDEDLTPVQFILASIMMVLALVSTCCSIATLWLIRSMGLKNGYISLISTLSLCQLLYDLNFFLIPIYVIFENLAVLRLQCFLSTFGGVAATLWTNVMSLVVYYVVANLRSYDILKNFMLISLCIYLPSLVFGIVIAAITPNYENIIQIVYFTVRCASGLVNILIAILIARKLQSMQGNTTVLVPLHTLTARLAYYPLWQSFYVICGLWYYSLSDFGGSSSYSSTSRSGVYSEIALCIYSIGCTLTGAGYFAIFLAMQPAAYNHMSIRVRRFFRQMCCMQEAMMPSLSLTDNYLLLPAAGSPQDELGSGMGNLLSSFSNADVFVRNQRGDMSSTPAPATESSYSGLHDLLSSRGSTNSSQYMFHHQPQPANSDDFASYVTAAAPSVDWSASTGSKSATALAYRNWGEEELIQEIEEFAGTRRVDSGSSDEI